ncbi:MAG: hypothetical protein NZM07_00990 [Elioraea sp.]|nr:hypothetical protein [Elioraea sp.]
MRRNGEDFGNIDPRRVEQIRDQILGAALGGPGGGGNARLRGELEKASENGKNLHDARLMFIERNAGLRWSEDGKLLEWGERPQIKPRTSGVSRRHE